MWLFRCFPQNKDVIHFHFLQPLWQARQTHINLPTGSTWWPLWSQPSPSPFSSASWLNARWSGVTWQATGTHGWGRWTPSVSVNSQVCFLTHQTYSTLFNKPWILFVQQVQCCYIIHCSLFASRTHSHPKALTPAFYFLLVHKRFYK